MDFFFIGLDNLVKAQLIFMDKWVLLIGIGPKKLFINPKILLDKVMLILEFDIDQ